jgi:diguanylate cyclase (GGDEF)-like protein
MSVHTPPLLGRRVGKVGTPRLHGAPRPSSMFECGTDICVIEDDGDQRRLLVRQLRRWKYAVVESDCGEGGLRLIYKHRPRVLICDVDLPDLSGIQVCREVRADPTLDGVFVVLATAFSKQNGKVQVLSAGADEYLRKPYDLQELQARIRSGMRFNRLQERLERAALIDGLTGLWNHSQFRELLAHEFLRTRRYGGRVSMLMIDLDHFKSVNDAFGHEVGNRVLKATARHLRAAIRETDIVARYGGEEFAVICPETSLEEAAQLAERIRKTFPRRVRSSRHPQLIVRASIGVSGSEDPRVNSVGDLITLGDQALYCSKRAGRNRVTRCDQSREHPAEPEAGPDMLDRLRKEILTLSMRSKDLCLQSVWALIQALEARDGYSAWHSRNVMLYTNWLVSAAGWSRPLRLVAGNAAMLHDLGKIGIADNLLTKPTPLEPAEAALMREVPLITCRILEPLRVFENEIVIIRHLRERYDGSGYPDGLAGDSIPIGSRLVAIAEAFDSITCDRAHRVRRSLDDALRIFRDEAGRQFDPSFVALLENTIAANGGRWQRQIDRARTELPGVVPHEVLG